MKWNQANDLAVFAPALKFDKQTPPLMIPSGCIVESDALFQYFDRLRGVQMFAIGYNNPPDTDLGEYLRKYMADIPATNGVPVEYDSLLWPHFKSVAIGSIRDIDPVRTELMVDCSVWKGFFGGLIAIKYLHVQPGEQSIIIGHIVSAKSDERFNRARLIPAGLRDYLRSVSLHLIAHEPGEMGFPRVTLANIQLPTEPMHQFNRSMRQYRTPNASWYM
ncbi:uncharacterized protein DFL_002440 [Arthrobotrys flagrans]|uniref:Uncharacterized protein n=1 Tax=Arthrobotrys flagrans TaxID=97331 RepID=A0A437AAG0_ARTFL|nr:hypothetical protein DFL_002440 [Arthrobotrys flagrans]